MAQQQIVRGVKTTISTTNGITNVTYRNTVVVSFDQKTVCLNSGGWRTATTKTRMMQASNQFELGFSVFQKNFEWFVSLPNGETVDFVDNMSFPRAEVPL